MENIIRFLMQLSIALLGASTLWGAIFYLKLKKTGKNKWGDLGYRALIVSFVALFIFVICWSIFYVSFYTLEAFGHEGIVLPATPDIIHKGFSFGIPFVFLLFLISAVGIYMFLFRRTKFKKYARWILASQFILASIIISFSVFTGEFFTKEQIFHSFHNWHSILTLGTVIMVDVLYISTLYRLDLKKLIYPFFPVMSAAIWIGLALDFASVALIFEEAFKMNTQLLFNQTVIAIIIINGALLSGKVNNLLIKSVSGIHKIKQMEFSPKIKTILGVSGSISIVSWLTITFLDFFDVPLSYAELFFGYIAIIALVFMVQYILENKLLPKIIKGI